MRSMTAGLVAGFVIGLALPVAAQRTVPLGPSVKTTQTAGTMPSPPKPAPGGQALTAEDVDAWLDGYMPYALRSGDIAGAVVAVVKGGQILTSRGYGYSDVAKRTPVDPALTLFRPGSVSKLLTWTAVMQQVELGKIDLDADVNTYLDFTIPPRDGKPVTMRQLMQHVAGFEEQAKDIISTSREATPSFDVLLKRGAPARIFAAGTTPAYSNYGASLAGYIVQRVSGEPFDAYIERHILVPLDMAHSTFRQPLPANLAPLMSKGYEVASKEAKPFEFVGPAPAGALSSTGEDMARFMIAHLQRGEYQGKRILQPATADMMHNSPLTMLPPLDRMELGFFETNVNGHEVIGHLGDTQNFHTSLHLFLNDGVGFYVSFNSPGKAGAVGGLRGAMFDDFADRYFPSAETDGRVDSSTAAKHAAMMAGTWVNSRRSETSFLSAVGLLGQLKVDGSKGELHVPLPGLNGEPRHWTEIAPFVWRDAGSHERLAAKVVDGRVVRMSFDGVSPFMVFDRAPWYADGAWLLPLLYFSLAALAITALVWPIAALVRRHYGAELALEPRARRAFRLSRIAATVIVVAMAGWAVTVIAMVSDLTKFTANSDRALWFMEVFGTVALIGGLVLMLWNLWVVWSGARRWPARTWSVVLSLSALVVLWFASVASLIHFGVNY
jgi:CubicO group peptidase (beta-lactamase class C family)